MQYILLCAAGFIAHLLRTQEQDNLTPDPVSAVREVLQMRCIECKYYDNDNGICAAPVDAIGRVDAADLCGNDQGEPVDDTAPADQERDARLADDGMQLFSTLKTLDGMARHESINTDKARQEIIGLLLNVVHELILR